MLATEGPRAKVVGEKFQVSYGTEMSVEHILNTCLDVTGASSVGIIRRPYRPGEEGMRECFDISKAKRVLGYEPKFAPYMTVFKTWEYIQSQMASLGVEAARRAVAVSALDPVP